MAKKAKQDNTEVAPEGMVAVVASQRGYDNTSSKLVEEGETFYVTAAQAKRGASWFKPVNAPEDDEELA